jgi:hypothetical protein
VRCTVSKVFKIHVRAGDVKHNVINVREDAAEALDCENAQQVGVKDVSGDKRWRSKKSWGKSARSRFSKRGAPNATAPHRGHLVLGNVASIA